MPVFYTGTFETETSLQEVKLAQPSNGRYFSVETMDAHDNNPFAAIVEIAMMDVLGNPISSEAGKISGVDCEECTQEDGSAENAIDKQIAK